MQVRVCGNSELFWKIVTKYLARGKQKWHRLENEIVMRIVWHP